MFAAHFGNHQQFQIHTQRFEWMHKAHLSIGGRCHLFNRAMLCQMCALPDTSVTNNFTIIEALYRKYGPSFVTHLLGEYALILWDNIQHRMICITDHFNNFGIFYSKNTPAFIISNDILGLQSLPDVGRAFNFRKIATGNCFTAMQAPGETFFSNIHYVPAASIMQVDSNRCISIEQYWTPTLLPEQKFQDNEAFSAAFQDVFSQIIASHTQQTPIMSLLSGGLDSSAITAMTANVLGKQDKQFTSLSAVLPQTYKGSVHDEQYYINLLNAPNLNKLFITDESRGPFDDLDTFLYSPIMTSRHYLYRAFNATAREHGVNVILDGCFGEMGPSFWGDERLAELLKKGQWLNLFQQSRAHHALFQRSWKSMIYQDMIQANLPATWQIKLKPRQDLDYIQRFSLLRNEFVAQFMTPAQRQDESDQLKLIGAKRTVDGRRNNALQLHNFLKRLTPSNNSIYEHQQSEVRYVYPLRDKRMIEFCLSVPNEWRYRHGYRRNIIRDGMRGMMPDELRFRISKEPFSPDFHLRYHRQIGRALDYINSIKDQALIHDVIDIPRLLEYMKLSMQSNRCHTKNDFICMHIIPSAIYLAAFLTNR